MTDDTNGRADTVSIDRVDFLWLVARASPLAEDDLREFAERVTAITQGSREEEARS